jgi:hypothetical protein
MAATPAGSELGNLWIKIQADAGLETIGRVALLPVLLSVVFLVLLFLRRRGRTPAGVAPV